MSVVSRNEKSGTCEVSLYPRGEVTPKILATEMKKLQVAFPKREAEFFNLLAERIVANGFTDQRLRDAVSKVIDTFGYKEINISDVIGFDRRVRLYTYGEMSDMICDGKAAAGDFEMREFDGRKYWIKRTEKL